MEENENTTPVESTERPLSPSEAYEKSQATNFFDSIPKTENSPSEDTEGSAPDEGDVPWFLSQDVRGEGPRPDWLKDKYKSVTDQAAAYSELERKLGETKGAPKEGYKLEFEDVSQDDELLQSFLPKFKELNLSQDSVNSLVTEFAKYRKSISHIDINKEMEKLGHEAKDMIIRTNNWLDNNLEGSVADTVKNWIRTAEDMRALNALRAFQPLSRSPSSSDMNHAVTHETFAEVKKEKIDNWQRYKDETAYRAKVDARMADAIRREEARKKR